MSDEWPGLWHSKPIEQTERIANDNGSILVSSPNKDQYIWYDPDGHDPRTEVRR